MICPANVKRSTMAAHSRGSVNVFVQEENGSLEAMAMAERSSRDGHYSADSTDHGLKLPYRDSHLSNTHHYQLDCELYCAATELI